MMSIKLNAFRQRSQCELSESCFTNWQNDCGAVPEGDPPITTTKEGCRHCISVAPQWVDGCESRKAEPRMVCHVIPLDSVLQFAELSRHELRDLYLVGCYAHPKISVLPALTLGSNVYRAANGR